MSVAERLLPEDTDLSLGEVHVLAGPTVLWFVLFLLVPVGMIVVYSFLTYDSFSVIWQFTLDPYTKTVLSGTVISATVLTIGIGLVVTAITLLFGYPIAYFLRFYLSQTAGILLLLFLVIPFWTSGIVRTLGYLPILGKTGVINQTLIAVGVLDEPISALLFTPVSMAIGYLQNYVVFMAAPIYISLSQIDEDLLDASETLRGTPVETFRNVTLPMSLPGVAIGCMFTFVLTIGNFTVPSFLSGGQGTISTLIYDSVNRGLRYPDASAMSITLLLIIFAFVYALLAAVDITDIAQG
jgi:ABC-type spermidine/putrescine transport system permease subunit I